MEKQIMDIHAGYVGEISKLEFIVLGIQQLIDGDGDIDKLTWLPEIA